MRRALPVLLVVLLSPSFLRAGVEVRATGDVVDVSATSAPVSEVLDGLARETKMKVVYEGGTPRIPVTVTLRSRTPAQAVVGVLEGLGLNFALVMDPSGTRVDTLMMVGGGRPSGGSPASGMGPQERDGNGRMRAQPVPTAVDSAAEEEEPADSVISPEDDGSLPPDSFQPAGEKGGEEKPAIPVPGPLNPVGFPGSMSPFAPGIPAGSPGAPVPVPTPAPQLPPFNP